MAILPDARPAGNTAALDRHITNVYERGQVGRQAHPAYQPRPLNVTATELSVGCWRLEMESRSRSYLAHKVIVRHGEAQSCDCEAAGYGRHCHHRRDGAAIASHLDSYLASLTGLQAMREAWRPEFREDIDAEWSRIFDAYEGVKALGYVVTTLTRCDEQAGGAA